MLKHSVGSDSIQFIFLKTVPRIIKWFLDFNTEQTHAYLTYFFLK